MSNDRITKIGIEGLRSVGRVNLGLKGLTVLIGENGGGKSSILEGCELLRRASEVNFVQEFQNHHGGLGALLRFSAPRLALSARIEGDEAPLEYSLALAKDGNDTVVTEESLMLGPANGHSEPLKVIYRNPSVTRVFDQEQGKIRELPDLSRSQLALTAFGVLPPQPAIPRAIKALSRIEIHLPFEVTPKWFARSVGRKYGLRDTVQHEPADRLGRLALNLPNAYAALKNDFGEDHWQETLEYVRLGLGQDVEGVNTKADPGGGQISLFLRFRSEGNQVSSAGLSDGMLAYLAFVALARLPGGEGLLAFDEPDLHFHPQLLMRVLDLLEEIAEERPVLIATHSDRFLDGLSEPAESVVLCDLDEHRATKLVRPNREALERWLKRYRGLGDIRAAGHQASVLTKMEQD